MLKPLHFCAWSHGQQTHLRYQDTQFHSSGTSLSVLWDALKTDNQQWFSREYGDVHAGQAENLFLVAPVVAVLSAAQKGPLTARLGNEVVREHFLSDAVCDELHLCNEEADFAPRDLSRVSCAIRLHDDCFATVQPVDRLRLTRLIHATLKLHSFYLSKEVDWLPVLEPLTDLLETVGDFEFISNTNTQTVFVDHPHQSIRRKRGLPVTPYLAHIHYVDGEATLHLRSNSLP